MSDYGLSWKGGKNFIADWVVDNLPSADCFIDLFFGGGAITHCAMKRNKYKTYIANDLLDTTSLFLDCVNGAISKDPKYLEWVSREDFEKRKTTELWVAIVYSFGNNCRSYMYSKELEPYKKAVHYAIVYNDFSLLDEFSPLFREKIKGDTWQERRVSLRGAFDDKQIIKSTKRLDELDFQYSPKQSPSDLVASKVEILEFLKQKYSLQSLERLQSLQSLQSLESLESLQRLQRLQSNKNLKQFVTTQKDYREYNSENIPKNSVVYLDPPYYNTDSYTTTDGNKNAFDNKELWSWIIETQNKRPDCLFVMSEYYAPDDFVCVGEKEKRVLLNNAGIEKGGRLKAMERLFVVQGFENKFKNMNGFLF